VRRIVAALLAVTVSAMVPATAHAEGGDPVGAFDSISIRLGFALNEPANPGNLWEIFGWAADPDAPARQLDLHVYVDGQPAQVIRTGDARPDVDAAVPFAGPNAGWHAFIANRDSDTHAVCVYAINTGAGTDNTTLGCKTFPIPGSGIADPLGNLDAVTVTPGLMRLQGWAGDGDAPDVTPVRPVIDGVAWDSVEPDPQIRREDVHTVFPALQNAAGFDATLAMVPGGHSVCLYAGNGGGNGFNNTSLGCTHVDVPGVQTPHAGEARGAFDGIAYDNAPGGDGAFEGWAWDPDAAGPYAVRIRDVISRFDFYPRVQIYDGQTGSPRPDVAAANPGAPPNTGFHISFPNLGAHTPTSQYTCAYALEGVNERFLGCVSG